MSWIKEGLLQRAAQKSTVIIFETWDPKRVTEFITAVLKKRFGINGKSKTFSKFFYYEPWKGLSEVSLTSGPAGEQVPRFEPVRTPSTQQPIKRLEAALDYVDNHLRSRFSCFVINNLFKPSDALSAAVRSWATDEQIYQSQSMIFIFVETASQILDDATLRFVERVDVPLSTDEERRRILTTVSRDALGRTRVPDEVIRAAAGLNLHQVESAALESIFRHQKVSVAAISQTKIKMIRDSGVLEPVETDRGFEAWGGYETVKQYLREAFINVLSSKRKLAEKLGMELPRGMLFFGPPGTGKTLAMQAIAKELGLPVFRLGSVFSKWVGESEKNIKMAIKIAEATAPCILYIDEVDRFGRVRTTGDHEVTRRVFSELLEWLGDRRRRTIVIGATNVPEELDPAFVRPGRLDVKVPILYPDRDAREEILRVHTEVVRKVPLKDVDLGKIAEKTAYMTGAELERLVKSAQLNAFRENSKKVKQEHFEAAVNDIEIDTETRKQEVQRYLDVGGELGCEKRFLTRLEEEHQTEVSRVRAFLEMSNAINTIH